MSEQNKNAELPALPEADTYVREHNGAAYSPRYAFSYDLTRRIQREAFEAGRAAPHQVHEGAAPSVSQFHRAWALAKESEGYDKAAFTYVQQFYDRCAGGAVQEGGGEALRAAAQAVASTWERLNGSIPVLKWAEMDDLRAALAATPPAPIVSAPVGDEWESARREISKWLNEEPNRPVDRKALAVLCAVPPGVARDGVRVEAVPLTDAQRQYLTSTAKVIE